jgi:NAD+ kinase
VEQAHEAIQQVAACLQDHGILTACGMLYDEPLRRQVQQGEFDMLIALGGDGTMLRAGHLCGPLGLPILGINMGHFGFLTEISFNQWQEVLPNLLSGNYWLEQRMMLCGEQWRAGQQLGAWEVLNEIVVCRGHSVRPVHLLASVDGRFLTTYVADGLIASTPTGSTAYALAAGGPILPPELRNILLVAVAPHLSLERAIVLSEGSSVSITVQAGQDVVLSPDGQLPVPLADGDQVVVHASDNSVHFVRIQDAHYFYRNLTPHMSQNPATGNNR